jgi:Protein of unknown function (DUF3089)
MRIRALAAATAATAVILAGFAAGASAKTVWLCKPGQKPDPCTPGLSTTVFSPTLTQLRVEHPKAVAHPAIDCFYVYPTVSGQPTGNANLEIDPEERSIALYQAARYSQYCRVYAPMYRQVTLAGIGSGAPPTTTPNETIPLTDVETAFETYLHKYNHGRGFVLIGHSQGSIVLRALIAKLVDPKPAVRRLLVSAILMGGNVLVKRGKDIGGDFEHIPACHAAAQVGCVIAFSTFDQPVPTPSLFGRPSNLLGGGAPKGDVVLCTNPAALAGGSGLLDPIWPTQPFDPTSPLAAGIALLGVKLPTASTVWLTEPGAYRAQCSSANDANVLQISAVGGAQTPNPSPTPEWGLHLLDANVALGNLLTIVKAESAAFARSGR